MQNDGSQGIFALNISKPARFQSREGLMGATQLVARTEIIEKSVDGNLAKLVGYEAGHTSDSADGPRLQNMPRASSV